MTTMATAAPARASQTWYKILYVQVLIAIVIGAIVQQTGSFRVALVFVAANAVIAAASFLFLVGKIERIELPKNGERLTTALR